MHCGMCAYFEMVTPNRIISIILSSLHCKKRNLSLLYLWTNHKSILINEGRVQNYNFGAHMVVHKYFSHSVWFNCLNDLTILSLTWIETNYSNRLLANINKIQSEKNPPMNPIGIDKTILWANYIVQITGYN